MFIVKVLNVNSSLTVSDDNALNTGLDLGTLVLQSLTACFVTEYRPEEE